MGETLFLTPEQGRTTVNTNIFGPLPKEFWGLLLGRSSSFLKGLTITPGVIDNDYEGEIKIMVESTKNILLTKGDRIAQLVLLPLVTKNPALKESQGTGSFESSEAYWVRELKMERPMYSLTIQEKVFQGILDTGADVSVLRREEWPDSWPLDSACTSLQGIGKSSTPFQSAVLLQWRDSTGRTAYFQPYVLQNLPINLWGRDVLSAMHLAIGHPKDLESTPFS